MDEKLLLEAIEKMMDEKINGLRDEVTGLREEMTRQNNETRVLVENGQQRIENLLREDYSRVESNAKKGATVADSYEETQSRINDLEHAAINHNERIMELEKKAAV